MKRIRTTVTTGVEAGCDFEQSSANGEEALFGHQNETEP